MPPAIGAGPNAALTDVRHIGNTTEFWVPSFTAIAIVDLDAAGDASVLESAYSARELELDADPQREEWRSAPRVVAGTDKAGQPVPGATTITPSWLMWAVSTETGAKRGGGVAL